MKRISTLLALLVAGLNAASAQTYPLFSTSENIDVGNIKAAHLVHGDMWWDPATATARCEYPKGSGKNVGFTSSLWMGGYNNQSALRFAAQRYRNSGNTDYWPGPIDTGSLAPVSYATSQKWAKIWKISSSQIDSFRRLGIHTAANTSVSILEWPAKGNPYAKGAGGTALNIYQAMAPFVDVNNDGLYNPLTGDYPEIKGDQMLWWVINDYGATAHTVSSAGALGIDIKISAYAYHRNASSDNIIFYEYQIRNHAGSAYTNFRLGIMADLDLGDANDDFTGFDSSRRLAFMYNGSNIDGTGKPGDYGLNPPMAGIAIVEMPGDASGAYVPAGSYVVLNNNPGPNGDPTNGVEMFRTMNSSNRIGTPLPNGMLYQYNADSECVKVHLPGDRRFVVAAKDMYLDVNAPKKIGMALVVAPGGGCPKFSFDSLYAAADTAYKYYWNPPAPQTTFVTSPAAQQLRIYPDPAKNNLFIEMAMQPTGTLQILDAIGRTCLLPQNRNGNKIELNTENLPPGLYSIRYQDAAGAKAAIFVKE